jgi:hypothetical protein
MAVLLPYAYSAVASYAFSAIVQSFIPDKNITTSQEGPRLEDLKIQSSTLGRSIPKFWGTMRTSGNMIWSRPILETVHTSSETYESGGKGGGGGQSQTVTTTTYTYSQSFAVALCEGPIVGVRRIWANGELIYDVGDTADQTSIQASNTAATWIKIYTGSETQAPDPTVQAWEGVANTPAYRGIAYVVFQDLQLERFGNHTPNLEFEVVASGSVTPIGPAQITTGAYTSSVTNPMWAPRPFGITASRVRFYCPNWDNGTHTNYTWTVYDMMPGVITSPYYEGAASGTPPIGSSDRINFSPVSSQSLFSAGSFIPTSGLFCNRSGLTVAISSLPPTVVGMWSKGLDGTEHSLAYSIASGSGASCCTDGTNIYLWHSGGIVTFDASLNYVSQISHAFTVNSVFGVSKCDYNNGSVWVFTRPWTDDVVYRVDLATGTVYDMGSIDALPGADAFCDTSVRVFDHMIVRGWSDQTNRVLGYALNQINAVTSGSALLSDIVTDIIESSSPLTAADIDVTQLTDEVKGYGRTQKSPARSVIEPLQQMYFFDVVESDSKLKFVKRGGAVQAVIPEADLAAHTYGSEMPDQLQMSRQQEVELPRETAITYLAADANYQTGAQYGRRLITTSQNVNSLAFVAALTDTKAKQIADVMTHQPWVARNKFKFATSLEYAKYEPTDNMQVQKGSITHTVRLTSRNEANGILSWEGESEDVSIYTQAGTASVTPVPPVVISVPGPTYVELMDIPMLRDSDDSYGFYSAACGYMSGWRGSQLYKSGDSGATWAAFGTAMLRSSTMGAAESVLGAYYGGNTIDEFNSVSVRLKSGALASVTEAAMLANENACLIGDELLCFRTATLTATDTYTLSGLLRGRRGTEWAMSTHVSGDRFVLLSPSTTYSQPDGSAETGIARDYKAASFGELLSNVTDEVFADTSARLKPLSPAEPRGGVEYDGALYLAWIRRGRSGIEWRDLVDVPLGESSASYDVEIYDATFTTLKRTFSALATPYTSYTAAQVISDFTSYPASVGMRVYQNSAAVGRGFPASCVVDTQLPYQYSFAKNWSSGSVGNQTLFGSGANQTVTSGNFVLTASPADEAKSRLDDIASARDFDLTITGVVQVSGKYSGVVYRTTYWGDAANTFAYAVLIHTGYVSLARGSNSATPSYATLQTATIETLLPGDTFTLRVIAHGSGHTILVDGVPRIAVFDAAFETGQIGIRVFDNTGGGSPGGTYSGASVFYGT